MKHVQPMLNTKRKSVLNERQLELHEFSKAKRSKKEERQKHRELKRYELPDNY
jgi:hypothetical protein